MPLPFNEFVLAEPNRKTARGTTTKLTTNRPYHGNIRHVSTGGIHAAV